ncbi:alkaline phosphatase family protein [Methanobacterium sp.]|uniref:alkaline phosphatase family protein n=1 Tax=Methanobacterium sp. TaxID=2164 RepID=UPI003C70EA73
MNNKSIKDKFFFPSDKYNLSKLPDSIISVLTPEKSKNKLDYSYFNDLYDKVVLFLIDGLGANYLQEFKDNSGLLKTIEEIGANFFLTCQFPSTTAANVTTIHTGLNVAQHGMYEWFYYEPLVDDIIAPVLFSYARDNERETLQNEVNPNDIYPTKTVYQKLNYHGVKNFVFQNKHLINTNYSKTLLKGADIKGYGTLSKGIKTLAECVNNENGKAYYLFYYSQIDKASHEYGPESKKSNNEVKKLLKALEKLPSILEKLDENILFILTSDHGQIALNNEKNLYLNHEFPDIEKHIKKSENYDVLVPAGSARDMFLYIEDEMIDDVLNLLQDRLYNKAVVCKTSYLIKNNYFGRKKISKALQSRLGNLAILPLENWTVWWYEKGVFETKNLGHHGGLSPDEIKIPLLVWEYQDWVK